MSGADDSAARLPTRDIVGYRKTLLAENEFGTPFLQQRLGPGTDAGDLRRVDKATIALSSALVQVDIVDPARPRG